MRQCWCTFHRRWNSVLNATVTRRTRFLSLQFFFFVCVPSLMPFTFCVVDVDGMGKHNSKWEWKRNIRNQKQEMNQNTWTQITWDERANVVNQFVFVCVFANEIVCVRARLILDDFECEQCQNNNALMGDSISGRK